MVIYATTCLLVLSLRILHIFVKMCIICNVYQVAIDEAVDFETKKRVIDDTVNDIVVDKKQK